MKRKYPKSQARRYLVGGIKIALIGELALFGVAYYYWRKMYTSQDYRKSMYQKYPRMMNMYYAMTERMGEPMPQKGTDYKAWQLSGDEK